MPPRLRLTSSRSSSSKEAPRRRSPRTTITIDGLGLHRIAREAIRDLHSKVEVLDAIVGLLDGVAAETFPGDESDHLRASTTMMKAALREIVVTAIDAAVAVGQVRFVGQLRSIEIEDGPEE